MLPEHIFVELIPAESRLAERSGIEVVDARWWTGKRADLRSLMRLTGVAGINAKLNLPQLRAARFCVRVHCSDSVAAVCTSALALRCKQALKLLLRLLRRLARSCRLHASEFCATLGSPGPIKLPVQPLVYSSQYYPITPSRFSGLLRALNLHTTFNIHLWVSPFNRDRPFYTVHCYSCSAHG